jgi:hypothetical protein
LRGRGDCEGERRGEDQGEMVSLLHGR